MSMTRRKFLQMLGLGAASAVAPKVVEAIPTPDPTPVIPVKAEPVKTVVGDIASDFVIGADNTIRYVGSGASHTVLDLHRWLQDEADKAPGDGLLDITSQTPSYRINDDTIELTRLTLDEDAATHLYGGSVVEPDGEVWTGIRVVGHRMEDTDSVVMMQDGRMIEMPIKNGDDDNTVSQFLLPKGPPGQCVEFRHRCPGTQFSSFSMPQTVKGTNVSPMFQMVDCEYTG